ncbi:MAG: ABC transporter permease [Dehalococcoidia bacterium]
MSRLLAVELFKLRQRPLTRVLLLVLMAIVVLLYVVLWAVTGNALDAGSADADVLELRRNLFLREAVPFGLFLVSAFGTLLAVILAAGAVGTEFGWGTIRNMLTCSVSRLHFLGAKYLAVLLLVAVGTLVGLLTAVLVSGIITAVDGGGDYGFVDGGYVWDSLVALLSTVYTMIPFITIAVFFGLWGRSTLAGAGAGIGVLVLEGIVAALMRQASGWVEQLPDYFPGVNADAIVVANGLETSGLFGGRAVAQLPDPTIAAGVLAGYIVVFLAAAAWLFQRRDVVA